MKFQSVALAALFIALPLAGPVAATPLAKPFDHDDGPGASPQAPLLVGPAATTLTATSGPGACPGPVPGACLVVPGAGVGFITMNGSPRPHWTVTTHGFQYQCNGIFSTGTIRVAGTGQLLASGRPCSGAWTGPDVGGDSASFTVAMGSHYYFTQHFAMSAVIATAPLPV